MSIRENYPGVKPSLLLDFANSKTVDPRITYACASPMPYYDGRTVVKAEENLLLHSQTFSNGVWAKAISNAATAPVVTPDFATAPDGTSTASRVVFSVSGTSTVDVSILRQLLTLPSAAFAGSIYIKSNTGADQTIDLSVSGAIAVPVTATSEWARISDLQTVANPRIQLGLRGSVGNSADILIWGAQLEQRDFVTAYTATTTQPITRYQPKLLEAPANVPTITHDPVTGECEGLQVYGQATNRALWGRDFSNAAWAKTGIDVTTGQIGLDGTAAACLLTATTSNGTIIQDLGVVASALKTGEVYLKRYRGAGAVEITLNGGSTWLPVTLTGTGYTKVRITGTLADEDFGIRLVASGDAVFADYGVVYTGNYAGPPIKTEGSQVTRAAVTITPHADSGSLGEGTLYAEYAASSAVASIGTAAIPAPANRTGRKTAVAFDSTSTITVTDNGTAATTAGSAGASALTVGQVNGTLEKIAVYPQKLTATEAGALTS
jgi:hypothetical protein